MVTILDREFNLFLWNRVFGHHCRTRPMGGSTLVWNWILCYPVVCSAMDRWLYTNLWTGTYANIGWSIHVHSRLFCWFVCLFVIRMMMMMILFPLTEVLQLHQLQVTVPFLGPSFQTAKALMDGKIQFLLAVINSGYLWILWMTFMSLPEEGRRFVTVAVGTVYPVIASTVCITNCNSNHPDHEETFWLTYWCCFSILFLAMDYLETFLGWIPGFYSLCLCATVYL